MSNSGPGRARRVGSDTAKMPRAPMLLFLLPLPMLFGALSALFAGNFWRGVGAAAGFALAMFGASLVRRGMMIENEAKKRKIKRRSSTLPYKALGAGACGLATAVAAWMAAGHMFPIALLFGLATAFGCYLVYGADLSRHLSGVPAVGVTSEEVIEILDEADQKIAAIESAADGIRNLELKQRLQGIVAGVREITGIIEDDPRDLRRARKFLKVYLDGAQRVTTGYAATHGASDNAELEQNFRNVLDTMENVIGEQKQRLLENNLTELDVQIEVLQNRLEREGV